MTKSIKEKKRLTIVKDIIKNNYDHINIDGIKIKLALKDNDLKHPFTKKQREEVRKHIKDHLISAVKTYKLFEFKVVIQLFEHERLLQWKTNSYKVFTYDGKKLLGELIFNKNHLGMTLVIALTSGKIISEAKPDFLDELLSTKSSSSLKITYQNIASNNIKSKIVDINSTLEKSKLFIKELEKNEHYLELKNKYNFKYDIDFYLDSLGLNYDVNLISLSGILIPNKRLMKINFNKVYIENTIEQRFIQCFLENGIINIDCFNSFNDENVSLIALIEYNNLLMY